MNIETEETFNLYERVFRESYNLPEVGEDQKISSMREEFKEKVMAHSISKKGFYKTQKCLMKIADEGRVDQNQGDGEDDEDDEDDENDMIP